MSSAQEKLRLRIGTVREHFSAPLQQLLETPWAKENVELVWQNSGTGQMTTSLDATGEGGRKIDVAIALTEALIAGIAKGRTDYKLVGSYVTSPLNWAIITGTDAKADKFQSVKDLEDQTIGISRLGSGSQTISYLMADQQGWGPDGLKFKVNDTFENLRKGVNQVHPFESAAFLWEWVTTLPYVHSGEVRFIGNVPTPWPSWSIVASTEWIDGGEKEQLLDAFLEQLKKRIETFIAPDAIAERKPQKFVEERFEYKPEDVQTWFENVRYVGDSRPKLASAPPTGQNTTTSTVSREMVQNTLGLLGKTGAISQQAATRDPAEFVRPKSLAA